MHVTDSEIEQFGRRRLGGNELVVFADHLEGCEECRVRVAAQQDQSSAVATLETAVYVSDDNHLTELEIAGFVDGTLPNERREVLAAHLEACGACAADVQDLSEFAAAQQRRPWGSSRAVFGALAAVLVLGIALASWSRLHHSPETSASVSPGAARVAEALTTKRLTLPSSLSKLAGAKSTLMGSVESSAFRLTAPVATAVLANPPTFQWDGPPGASTYVVTLQDESSGETISSPSLTGNQWTPARELVPGRIYAWQVAASVGGRETITPRPPAPPARFTIADALSAAMVQQMPVSHLERGVIYAEAGLLDDAEREFDLVGSTDPAAGTVSAFRDQIRRAREPR